MLIISALGAKGQATAPPIFLKHPVAADSIAVQAIGAGGQGMRAASTTRVFLQFTTIPDSRKKQVLKARGIELLDYIPENTYLANVSGSWSVPALRDLGIRATIPLTRAFKKDQSIPNGYTQSSTSGKYHLVIAPGSERAQVLEKISALFRGKSLLTADPIFLDNRLVEIGLQEAGLDLLLDQPFVLYALPAPKLMALNSVATDHLLGAAVQQGTAGVPGLKGKGVVMGMGDEGRAEHIDNGYDAEGQDYNSGYHSTHVAGTMIGAGIVNPLMKGFAPEATLLVDFFNTIIYRTPTYYQQKRMVLTNNSYGAGSYCVPYSGEYSGYSGQADQQLLDFPNLLHVFAAGNSGDLKCGNYPVGYRSIDNSFQAAKNVLTVGGTSHDGLTNKFSRGPVNDGRLKPEISGIGNAMLSTIMGNAYGSNQGTSMSAPQVTGALALLYQRYRQLNGDLDPPGDLAKAIICNTATDIGTPGVDFSTGFGWVNLQKAIEVVNKRTYRTGSLEQGGEQVFEIDLDKEVFDFKLMLYWHDQPSSYYTLKNLVNDLDLTVQLPDGSVYDPMVLDTSAAGVTNPAVMGKDHLNNIEQVVIGHALPGRYTVRVKGYKVPVGPQQFRVVYSSTEPGLKLIQPAGGEQWKPNELRGIHWEDGGHDGDVYSFDYSVDGGNSWIALPGLTGTYNRVDWTLPTLSASDVRVRIQNSTQGTSAVSPSFVVMPETVFTLSSPCASEIAVNWSKPAGIDSVAVLLYRDKTFIQQVITTDTSYTISGLRNGPLYWISLQPWLNGRPGERSIAQQISTSGGACAPSGTNGDLQLKSFLLPPTAREGSSSAQAGNVPVVLHIINNGNSITTDTVFADLQKDGIFWGRDTLVKSFTGGEQFDWVTQYNFPAIAGTAVALSTTIHTTGDTTISNNRKDSLWRYLLNPPIQLPYADDFTGIRDTLYGSGGFTGAFGAEAWDFKALSPAVGIRTAPAGYQPGFVTMSKLQDQSLELTGTFNLAAFSFTDNLRMDLDIPGLSEMGTALYIRGSDQSPWLVLPLTDPTTGLESTRNLNISGVLSKFNQPFSSSFQVKITGITSSYLQEMEMLKSIRIYTTPADMALIDLNYTQARVTDGDSMQIVLSAYNRNLTSSRNFVIGLRTPDGEVQTATIDTLAPNKIAFAAFTIRVKDWPAAVAPITAWVHHPQDAFPGDDSLQAIVAYYRKISQYPYLQGFEKGEAGWGKSFLYNLSPLLGEAAAPFHAANGQVFWGTRRVDYSFDVAYPVSAGYLVSPLFDTRTLSKPWLSMSVNKQLCDGMDSVIMQYSADTGRTWKSLPATALTTNWYDQPKQGSWKGCGNDYWQVVSTPLPATTGGIVVRVLLRGTNALADEFPRLPGGLLVDDVHVFDAKYPIHPGLGAATASSQETDGQQTNFLLDGKLLAAYAPAGSLAGNTLKLAAPVAGRTYQGNRVMPRSWVFNGNAAAAGLVRLFFTHQEVMNWLGMIPCDTCTQKRSPYDLAVYRYAGPDALINETDADNTPGYEETWPAAAFDLVPYESGYYAELPAAAYGEFYIGLDEKSSGLRFTAERQEGADIVHLRWSLGSIEGISRFEVERAVKTDGVPEFSQIGVVAATTDTAYGFRDIWLKAPGSWHYRIKVIYANGDTRYSAIRTISFDKAIVARLYPNPSTDGQVSLLLENTEGKRVDLALYDNLGRYLWGRRLDPVAQQQLVPLSIGDGRLPNGVYSLKISTATEKKAIQLVISRN